MQALDSNLLNTLISDIAIIKSLITPVVETVKKKEKPYLNVEDIMFMTGFKKAWVYNRKERIGFLDVDGSILFKKEDVDLFLTSHYFKAKS